MQLNMTTDYAVRMVLILGDGQMRTIEEISEQAVIPHYYVGKIVKKLKSGGLLGSAVGVGGGVFLKRPLSEISLFDVFSAMEPTMKLNRCLETDAYCSRNKAATCPVRKYYQHVQDQVVTKYLSVSLEDVANGTWNREDGACGGEPAQPIERKGP